MTDIEFLKLQCSWYNSNAKQDKEGFDCTACKNRRYFAEMNNEGFMQLRRCTCQGIIASRREAEQEDSRRRTR